MTHLLLFLFVVNVLLFAATGLGWFVLGAMGFFVGAIANAWLEHIQARVVAELSKTCQCALCKANRGDLPP